MVTILPQRKSPFQLLGDATSQFGANAPQLLEERFQTQRGLSAIDQLQNDLKESGGDMTKVLPAVAKAVSLNPNLQKSGYVEHALQMAKAMNANKAPLAGEIDSDLQPPQRQQLPSFMGQNDQLKESTEFFPTNVGPKEDVGNIAQEATTGKKLPLLSPDQYPAAAHKLSKAQTDQGFPTTPQQALELVKQHEDDKKIHNAKVDEELSQRVSGQQKYGERAVKYLNKAFGENNVPPEVQAYFAKQGEGIATSGKSEAEIDRFLAEKAKNFANSVSNIKSDISAPRLHKDLLRGFNGTYKSFEESAKDAQKHLKPLLDAQLYDYSRGLLADQGYYPEEREIIVNPLTQKSQALLNAVTSVPKNEKPVSLGIPGIPAAQDANAGDIQDIKTALMELKRIEPNFSLPLSRKMLEDKGYGWRTYKDALNELQDEGFVLEDDQRTQMGYLDSPPESRLEGLLRSLNLIGR